MSLCESKATRRTSGPFMAVPHSVKQPHTPSISFPIFLTSMCLDCCKKRDKLERTLTGTISTYNHQKKPTDVRHSSAVVSLTAKQPLNHHLISTHIRKRHYRLDKSVFANNSVVVNRYCNALWAVVRDLGDVICSEMPSVNQWPSVSCPFFQLKIYYKLFWCHFAQLWRIVLFLHL